jgi:hypothetical protein
MYPIYVHGPRNSEELDTVTSLHAACGFPGCDGNIVHRCGHQSSEMNFASIACEMTVDHTKRFQSWDNI